MTPQPVLQRYVWLPNKKWIDSVCNNCYEISGGGVLLMEEREIILWKNTPQKQLKRYGMVWST